MITAKSNKCSCTTFSPIYRKYKKLTEKEKEERKRIRKEAEIRSKAIIGSFL